MDTEEDTQVPLLVGRPFLAPRAALIDVKKMRIHSQGGVIRSTF